MDPTFDPDFILAILEDPRRSERYQAKKAEVYARIDRYASTLLHQGDAASLAGNASAGTEKKAGEGNTLGDGRMIGKPVLSPWDIDPIKWAAIVKADASGKHTHIRLGGGQIVAVAKNRAESEIKLKIFLKDAFKDMDDEWVRLHWIN